MNKIRGVFVSFGRGAIMLRCLLVGAVLVFAGCHRMVESTATHTDRQSIDLDKSEMVRVELSMGAGELRLRGGTSKLMEGSFQYHGDRRPEVRFEPNSFRSRLVIRSADSNHRRIHTGGIADIWDIRLNEDVPMDLDVKMGAGENRLDLGNFNIRDLDVKIGVGAVQLDLRGTPKRSMNVRIHGGIGEAKVWLPENVGIRADARGGIGSINVRGLNKRGGSWESSLYRSSPITVNVDVNGGIGSISILAE